MSGADGITRQKADPFATYAEVPPANASVVYRSRYTWSDEAWLERRRAGEPLAQPFSAYEVHAGSWRQGLSWRELAEQLVPYVADLGFTHVELMPVMQHPYPPSWGYQVSGYFAPQSTLGTPDDFRALVDAFHGAGVGVILDWVPAHFPRDEWALARFDGTSLYEHEDPRRGSHPDWGTLIFNFSRHEVRNFLLANALYWVREFHADGLRVDAVASMLYLDYSRDPGQWLPNEQGGRENLEAVAFLRELNEVLHAREPGVAVIAEESTAWPGVSRPTSMGGLGFTFKWNMGWMHDTLAYAEHEPVHRRFHHDELTFSLVYAWDENFVLPLSHDEVVHGKRSLLSKLPGDRWQQLATLRALYGFMWAHPGKQLLFMGGELAEWGEWSEGRSLDWPLLDDPDHAGVRALVRDLNARLPRAARSLGGGLPAGGLRLARRRRPRRERDRVLPLLGLGRAARLRRQLLPDRARGLASPAAAGRRVGRDAQHRLAVLCRVRRGKRSRDHGGPGADARAAGLGARHLAAARGPLARARVRRPGAARAARLQPGGGATFSSSRPSSVPQLVDLVCRQPAPEPPVERDHDAEQPRVRGVPCGRELDDDGTPVGGVLTAPHEPLALERVEVPRQRRPLDPDGGGEVVLGAPRRRLEVREHEPHRDRAAGGGELVVERPANRLRGSEEAEADRSLQGPHLRDSNLNAARLMISMLIMLVRTIMTTTEGEMRWHYR